MYKERYDFKSMYSLKFIKNEINLNTKKYLLRSTFRRCSRLHILITTSSESQAYTLDHGVVLLFY